MNLLGILIGLVFAWYWIHTTYVLRPSFGDVAYWHTGMVLLVSSLLTYAGVWDYDGELKKPHKFLIKVFRAIIPNAIGSIVTALVYFITIFLFHKYSYQILPKLDSAIHVSIVGESEITDRLKVTEYNIFFMDHNSPLQLQFTDSHGLTKIIRDLEPLPWWRYVISTPRCESIPLDSFSQEWHFELTVYDADHGKEVRINQPDNPCTLLPDGRSAKLLIESICENYRNSRRLEFSHTDDYSVKLIIVRES